MDTLKSLVVISMLGAVLYGVYIVAGKQEESASSPLATQFETVTVPPVVETPTSKSPSATPSLFNAASKIESFAPSLPEKMETAVGATPTKSFQPNLPPPLSSDATEESKGSSAPSNSIASNDVTPVESSPLVRSAYEHPAGLETKDNPPATSSKTKEKDPSDDAKFAESEKRVRLYAFHQTWKAAQDQVQEGHYREALSALSAFCHEPAVPEAERKQLMEWLDALAAKVVYSNEHLLTDAHTVRKGETLYSIGDKYGVPYLLLKNINGVRDPELLVPGTKLKIVPGPFQAVIDAKTGELTLFVQSLYAGRFQVEFGGEAPTSGDFAVREKRKDRAYYGTTGMFTAEDPRNPYGGIWLDLGNDVCLHGSPGDAYADNKLGCLGLAQRDAEDLYGILSVGSKVTVR